MCSVVFCYFVDILSSDDGCEHTVLVGVNQAWNKFRELKSFLYAKRISLNVKGKVYEAFLRSYTIYGGETWALSGKYEEIRKNSNEKC